MSDVSVRKYVPHSGRVGYSVASADGKRVYLVTSQIGVMPSWEVWKSDSLRTLRRFAATEVGRLQAIEYAKQVAR